MWDLNSRTHSNGYINTSWFDRFLLYYLAGPYRITQKDLQDDIYYQNVSFFGVHILSYASTRCICAMFIIDTFSIGK